MVEKAGPYQSAWPRIVAGLLLLIAPSVASAQTTTTERVGDQSYLLTLQVGSWVSQEEAEKQLRVLIFNACQAGGRVDRQRTQHVDDGAGGERRVLRWIVHCQDPETAPRPPMTAPPKNRGAAQGATR